MDPAPETRVLFADDSMTIRIAVSRQLRQIPGVKLTVVEDGLQAVQEVERQLPDLVILDVHMPTMDGLDALRAIRAIDSKLPVIMFSSLTKRGAATTLDALAEGATDCITKPDGSPDGGASMLREMLAERIEVLCKRNRRKPRGTPPPAPTPKAETPRARPRRRATAPRRAVEVIAIASSTGGPAALAQVIPLLPANLGVPIVIVQHMPPTFTELLAKSLDRNSALDVREGQHGDFLEPGGVWIAPGGLHMEVRRAGVEVELVTHDGPLEQSVRPAADVLFRSVAAVYGPGTLSVVLTGMGKDGFAGCEAIRRAGGHIVVQDEDTSVVWGMPGFVARAGLADDVEPLGNIATSISNIVEQGTAQRGVAT